MTGRFRLWTAVSLMVLALFAAGCSSSGKNEQNHDGSMMNESKDMGGMDMGGKDSEEEYTPPTPEQLARVNKTVEITLNDQFRFEPKDITVKKGEVVKFMVRNAGKLPHDWMAEGIKEVATGEFPGGEDRVIVWEADRTGTFTTYCMVAGHKAAGMTGTLAVTE